MPFDSNGIWQSEITHEPQTGALAGLQILNQFQSQQNFQRDRAAQLLDQILKLRSQGGSDVSQTPEGGSAMETLGIRPEDVQSLYAKTPEARFRTGISEIPNPTMEDVTKLGLTTGEMAPTAVLSSFRQGLRTKETETSDAEKALTNAFKSNLPHFDSPQAAAAATKAQMLASRPDYWKGREQQLDAMISAQPEFQGGVSGARAGELQARKKAEEARAEYLNAVSPADVNLRNARSVAAISASHANEALATLRAAQANGTLPMTASQTMNDLIKLRALGLAADKATAQSVIPGTAIGVKQDRASIEAAIKEAEDMMTTAHIMAASAPAPAPAAPAGGAQRKPAAKAKPYASQDDFIKAFKADSRNTDHHPPSAEDLKRAAAAGLF